MSQSGQALWPKLASWPDEAGPGGSVGTAAGLRRGRAAIRQTAARYRCRPRLCDREEGIVMRLMFTAGYRTAQRPTQRTVRDRRHGDGRHDDWRREVREGRYGVRGQGDKESGDGLCGVRRREFRTQETGGTESGKRRHGVRRREEQNQET